MSRKSKRNREIDNLAATPFEAWTDEEGVLAAVMERGSWLELMGEAHPTLALAAAVCKRMPEELAEGSAGLDEEISTFIKCLTEERQRFEAVVNLITVAQSRIICGMARRLVKEERSATAT